MWNNTPIRIVFYKDTPPERLLHLVNVHCSDHHPSKIYVCMALINMCIDTNMTIAKFESVMGDIMVYMITPYS